MYGSLLQHRQMLSNNTTPSDVSMYIFSQSVSFKCENLNLSSHLWKKHSSFLLGVWRADASSRLTGFVLTRRFPSVLLLTFLSVHPLKNLSYFLLCLNHPFTPSVSVLGSSGDMQWRGVPPGKRRRANKRMRMIGGEIMM